MNIMDHEQAIKMHAAERYLLDELTSEERDDFEEHYFMCVTCADEVRSAFTFADNAKAVFREKAQKSPRPVLVNSRDRGTERASFDWWAWLRPAMIAPVAAAALLCVTLYQSVLVIPRLQRDLASATQPRVVPTVAALAATRGEDPVIRVAPDDASVQVIVDINPTANASSYVCEVVDAAGNVRFTVPATVVGPAASFNIFLPAKDLAPGRYVIRTRPQTGTAVMDEHSFVLQR